MPAGSGRQSQQWLKAHECTLVEGHAKIQEGTAHTVVMEDQDHAPRDFDYVFTCMGGGGDPAPYLRQTQCAALAAATRSRGRLQVTDSFEVPGTDGRVLAVGDLCLHPAHLMQTAHMAKWAARGAATTVALANGRSTLRWSSWPAYLWGPPQRWPPIYCVSLGRYAAVVVVNKTALPQIVGRTSGGIMKMAIEVHEPCPLLCTDVMLFVLVLWHFFLLRPPLS